MEITEFVFRLFTIFVPGLVAFIIIDLLTVHEKNTPFYIVLYSAVLGFLCYLIYLPITKLFNIPFTFFTTITDSQSPIAIEEVAIVTVISIPIGLIITIIITYKILYRIAYALRISRKISDPGVWSHLINSNPKKLDTQWINIIDDEKKLLYHGFLKYFSDNSDKENEIFLQNVEVYNYIDNQPGRMLYQTPAMYLNSNRERLRIEFPNIPYIELKPTKKSEREKGKKIKIKNV